MAEERNHAFSHTMFPFYCFFSPWITAEKVIAEFTTMAISRILKDGKCFFFSFFFLSVYCFLFNASCTKWLVESSLAGVQLKVAVRLNIHPSNHRKETEKFIWEIYPVFQTDFTTVKCNLKEASTMEEAPKKIETMKLSEKGVYVCWVRLTST